MLNKIWIGAGFGFVTIGVALAAYSLGAAAPVPHPVSPAPAATSALGETNGASQQALSVMNRWMKANEGCQGGTNVTPDSPICKTRDDLGEQAKKMGWCWAYSDWRVTDAQYQWHRCSVSAPKGFVPDPMFNGPAPAPSPVSADPETASLSEIPDFDTEAYCRRIGDAAGGSYMIERTCRQQEDLAVTAIRSMSIPPRTVRYCSNVGSSVGGSYMIYKTCVDQELSAATDLEN